MALSLVTAPTDEPITWAQVQKQLHLDGLDDDQAFVETIIIPAVRDRCELATGRQLLTARWRLPLDWWPGWSLTSYVRPLVSAWPCSAVIDVPKPPLQYDPSGSPAIAIDISYVDTTGVTQTLASSAYDVDAPVGPRCRAGRIAPAFGTIWPLVRQQMNAITVAFTAGYGAPADVPPLLIAAMLQDAATLYENRESLQVGTRAQAIALPGYSDSIYRSYKSYARTR